jgi:hypothetical protein
VDLMAVRKCRLVVMPYDSLMAVTARVGRYSANDQPKGLSRRPPFPLARNRCSAGVRNAADIESAITAFARDPNGGLIIAPSPFNTIHQDLIISLAARLHPASNLSISIFFH